MPIILPRYTHIVNRRLKHTYLSFDEEGELVIRSPKVSQSYIESLLIKKSSWIEHAREKMLAKKGRIDTIREGGYFYLFGEPRTLQFEFAKRKYPLLHQENLKHYIFSYTHFDAALCRKKVEALYRKEAEQMIPPMVAFWSKKMGVTPAAIRFRKTRRQWGSCSSRNTLSFNTMLMKAPMEAIEYVVVHELAHIIHKHHRPAFWQLVSKHLPDYEARQDLLRQFTPA